MRKLLKTIMMGTLVAVTVSVGLSAEEAKGNDVETMKLIKTAMSSRAMIQRVAKDYLYIGNDVAITKAEREMQEALKKFNAKLEILNRSLNDPKSKNLLLFIESNMDEVTDLLKEPYSLDNAQEIIDLAEAISEGGLSIGNRTRKKLKSNMLFAKGQRYYTEQIAKYYMAYCAGIQDKNTVKNMNKTVKILDGLIKEMQASPANTPEMNQIMNRIGKQWKIIRQFYLNINDGDLPLIVYSTAKKLEKNFLKYAKALIQSKSSKK